MLVPITALFAIVLTLIGSYLAFRAGGLRGKTKVSVGDGGNPELLLEMRRHANFAEFVPLALILMAVVELNGGSAGLLYGAGGLLVLARINRGVDREAPAAELSAMSVVCPRCRKKQSLDIGDSSCSRCGLRISVRVEEPR